MYEYAPPELPPELYDVKELFASAIAVYGIEGAEKLVNDLAAEAEAANSLAESIEALEKEEMTLTISMLGLDQLLEAAGMLEELELDSLTAKRRLEFAMELLDAAKKEDSL